MRKILFLFLILIFSSLKAQIPAFPTAEGDGMYTTGGRGGQILYVTKLTDDGSAGTLRWATNLSGARIIMFKVAGLIPLTSELRIKNGNLTIAGQSAPGDGICLKNYPVVLQANNVIMRFMRFRMGDEAAEAAKLAGNTSYGWDGADAIWGRDMTDIILDHCSMSWNIDECSSFYDNKRFTMQWCFMSESMRNSVHSKGAHGYGGIWGGEPATYHHNILAFHDSRNPRFCGSRYTNSASTELVNFCNNVIYNWGGNSGYAGEGGRYNMINNYYRSGTATGSSATYRIFSPNADDGTNSQTKGIWGTFYLNGNVMKNTPTVTSNNWIGFQPVSLGTKSITDLESFVPFPSPILTTQTANEAYLSVTAYAGASLKRDAVDTRVANNILNGTVSCTAGSNGSTGGFIDSQKDVGGWPTYAFDPNSVPVDTDGDGMPDSWETTHGLDPNNSLDGTTKTLDGNYTNVEVYLNELVKPLVDVQTKITATENVFSQSLKVYPNPIKNGNITINADNTIVSAQLISLNGIKLNEFKTASNTLSIPMDNLKTGVYILKIILENGVSTPTIILKQ
jgi:hypothetical protein